MPHPLLQYSLLLLLYSLFPMVILILVPSPCSRPSSPAPEGWDKDVTAKYITSSINMISITQHQGYPLQCPSSQGVHVKAELVNRIGEVEMSPRWLGLRCPCPRPRPRPRRVGIEDYLTSRTLIHYTQPGWLATPVLNTLSVPL